MSFTPATEYQRQTTNLVASLWGHPKSGKTQQIFGMVAGDGAKRLKPWPTPIFFIDFNQGTRGPLNNADPRVLEQVYIANILGTGNTVDKLLLNKSGAGEIIREADARLKEAVKEALAAKGGTVAIDIFGEYYQFLQAAEIEINRQTTSELTSNRLEYGPLNAKIKNLVLQMKASGLNVVLIHHAREVYSGRTPQGRYLPQQNSNIDGIVDVQLHTLYTESGGRQHYKTQIDLCRDNAALRGTVAEDLDYPTLYSLIFDKEPEGYEW